MIQGQRSLLAGISHELRTPLTRLKLQTTLLEEHVDVEALHHEIKEMDALIEILLISSQLKSGVFHLQKIRLELNQLVLDVFAEIGMGDRYCSLQIPLELYINSDRLLLRRVIWNVLSNVVKYTPNTSTVSLKAQKLDGGVELICSDSGPGVSDEYIERLSLPFWRFEHSRSKETGGWGLGLSFVKQVINAHDGRFNIEHNHPHGLLLRMWLPD